MLFVVGLGIAHASSTHIESSFVAGIKLSLAVLWPANVLEKPTEE
jgi:hypothetical protein